MVKKYRLRNSLIVLFGIFFIGGGLWAIDKLRSMPIPNNAEYMGSNACAACHDNEHKGWHDSLHPKMMQRVDKSGVVVADFSEDAEGLQFELGDAVWAIGSKWEQQFMGHNGKTETLLPGAWLVEQNKWKVTGWDGWKVPEPLKRCHGCHTVGLNTNTGEFIEPGVGCESCHGPGSWHIKTRGLGKIVSSLDPQICGQCHTRGKSLDDKYFFAAGYKPGDRLTDYFKERKPTPGQNSNKWWGNGRERKRHQEYYAWRQGGHVNSLKSLKENYDGKYGKVTNKCLNCHAAKAILSGGDDGLTLEEAEYGITCAVCHNVHGDLDKPRTSCDTCHGDGAYHHKKNNNTDHIVCTDSAKVTCVNCHMPLTVKNGGGYTLHSHRFGIIPPEDSLKYGVPNSCGNGGCHTDKSMEWLQSSYKSYYSRSL